MSIVDHVRGWVRRYRPARAAAPALALACAAPACLAQPAVDGLLDDWATTPIFVNDPVGDGAAPFDLRAIRVQSAGTRLFVQFDIGSTVNLPSGPATDPTLRLIIARGNRTLTINFRSRTASYFNGSTTSPVTWTALNFSAAPTVATSRFELEVDTALMGAALGDTLQLNFSGADALAASTPFTLTNPAQTPERRSPDRSPCANLRVVSLNTFVSGFAAPARRAQFVRLIDAVNADVYCFQEEYDGTLAQAQSIINEADALDNGVPWNVLKAGELVIASPHALIPVNLGTPAYQGAVVVRPGGHATFVLNNHMKCCGHIGSTEDATRISQTQTAIAAFNAFRAGTLSPELAPYADAPAIVIGDWNHVGSSTPMDLWLASPGPELTQATVRHLIGRETWTWAAPSGTGFWPGLLDVVAFDAYRSAAARSFVLDSAELNADELAALGLQAGDSAASDHRMLVVDLADGPSADLNGDSGVNTADLTYLLSRFSRAASSAPDVRRCDFNRDGTVNTPDLTYFLARFGVTCN
ncbi:MAG: hypothetical protein ACKVZJ_13085 [Phycisphaerales bacterium]